MPSPLARPWQPVAGALFAVALVSPSVSRAACPSAISLEVPIAQAAARFGISEAILRAVIAVESNFMVLAVSPKGAMGLMQLMPGTWQALRVKHAFGTDPFDPCDNILAGAAYLRELHDRYGDPGFLAAYHAGPGRYEAYRSGRPLPAETLAYVAQVQARRADRVAPQAAQMGTDRDPWRAARLFVHAPDPEASQERGRGAANLSGLQQSQAVPDVRPAPGPLPESLFVPRTGVPK
ncbi:lytic transglycosylase domain-containing protein [Sphingomonas sp. CJ20]